MYLNELRAYYPRQTIKIQRVGLSKYNNLNIKSLPVQDKDTQDERIPAVRGKLPKILLGPLNFFYLFMENSSIHGFNHLTNKKLHVFE